MIKYILRLSIAAFIIIFTYDTINFYLENSKVPKENQVVFVRPKVELVEQKVIPEPLPDYYKDNVLWYGGIGAVAVGSLGVLCYTLSAVTGKPARLPNDEPKPIKGNGDSSKKDSESELVSSETVKSRHSSKPSEENEACKEKELESKTPKQVGEGSIPEQDDAQTFSTPLLEKRTEEKSREDTESPETQQSSRQSIEEPPMPPDLSEESRGYTKSPESQPLSRQSTQELPMSPSSTQKQEDGTGVNSLLAENLSEQLMGNLCQQNGQGFYEDSDILVGSRLLLDSEISYKSRDSLPKEMTIVSLPEQILAALTSLQPNGESGTFPTLLTQDDLDTIEHRLSNIESKVALLDQSSAEYVKRLELAESELVDLHEQIYTILTKLEEEQKPNYIIVSQMAMLDEMKDSIIKEVTPQPPAKTDTRLIEFNQVQENIESEKKLEEIENNDQHAQTPLEKNRSENLCNKEDAASSGDQRHTQSGRILKSVGLEAILLKEIPPRTPPTPPRKANPRVPSHYVQPYKRSTFTATDTMSDIKKVSRKLIKARN